MGVEENKITQEIMSYLRSKSIFHFRMNTGRRGKVSYGYPGAADIIGLLPDGRFLAIECKTKTGIHSDKQKEFQFNIQVNNGLYILARCLEDVTTHIL